MREFNILNLGAGVQSSRVLLGSCRGELPKFDAAIFADTMWEPKAVYANLEFLKGEALRAGIPLIVASTGDIRADAVEFRRAPRSTDGKRYASIPVFIKNPNGSGGRVKRQCTSEYKIKVVEQVIRQQILGLPKKKRTPKGIQVNQWFGISNDESQRAVPPGRYIKVKAEFTDLFGKKSTITKSKRWIGTPWRRHVYPLMNGIYGPDRRFVDAAFLPGVESRHDCMAWLAKHYPGRTFPRSACLGCPFRSNAEWRDMRENAPDEFEDACRFDDEIRVADHDGPGRRGLLVGLPYIHRQLVPLRMADLGSSIGETGGGCGTLRDGMDGLCDV